LLNNGIQTIDDVGIKFAESNGEAQPEVKVKHQNYEWEELTFNFVKYW
jgi:hypothetical protein